MNFRQKESRALRLLTATLMLSVAAGCTVSQERDASSLPPAEPPTGAALPPLVPSGAQPPQYAAPTYAAPHYAGGVSTAPVAVTPAARPAKIAEVYRATGPAVARQSAQAAARPAGDITLNFEDADVRQVAQVVLRDILNVNYVIDPEVKGKITVHTGQPLTRDQVLPVFETLLSASGNALIQADGIYRVAAGAAAAGSTARLGAAGAGSYGVEVEPLRYINAAEMAKILKPLLPQGGIMSVDAGRNVLVLSGAAAQLKLARDTIKVFDVDQMAGQSVLLESLQNADVNSVVFELRNVFGSKEGDLSGLVRFLPIERLNAVLVLSRQPHYLNEAHDWIARLDRTRDMTRRSLFVYYVQNGKASVLAKSLRGIFGDDYSGAAAPARRASRGVDVGRLGVNGMAAGTAAGTAVRPGGPGDTVPASATLDEIYPPGGNGAQSKDDGALTPMARTAEASADDRVRIVADQSNNALLIRATPREYQGIEDALSKLDVMPLQVLIEASIIEVRLNDTLRYGVQYFLDSSGLGGGNGGRTILTSGLAAGINPITTPAGGGFAFVLGSTATPKVIVDALSSVTQVNVVSTPRVLALDNQTAKLQVGDEVPIITQFAAATNVDSRVLNTVQYRQTGVTLEVVPRVNTSGLVTLEIGQEVSDVSPTTTSTINSPTIQQRRILTTVAVKSGETVALGGLVRENNTVGNSGIPLLSELPVVGALFGSRNRVAARTELLVIITPKVVRNAQQARDVTQELRRKFQAVLELEGQGPPAMRRPIEP